ncbi:MAG TPA: MFS transporter [Chloroflexota bacterium]|nr:MFS transporter [Chloroflexota bacterium]
MWRCGRWRPGGLWRHAGFVRLWSSTTISSFGGAVTSLAFPLTAVLVLDATPAQMGLLGAAGGAAFLLFGLPAGAWIDRRRRRPILIAADLARAALLASVPVAATLGWLRIEQLYVVAFLLNLLSVFAEAASGAFMASLVRREQLAEANGRLEASRSVAHTAGPGLAGALVQLVTAPVAITLDAVSYLASAALLGTIRAPEPPQTHSGVGRRPSLWHDIGEGLQAVWGRPVLRAIAVGQGIFGFSSSVIAAVYVLFVTRELGLAPAVFGALLGLGNLGNLAAALLNGAVVRRFGLGSTMAGAALLTGVTAFLAPLAGVVPAVAVVPVLLVRQVLTGVGLVAYMVNQVSLRQMSTPDRLQGRVGVTTRYVSRSAFPLGALAGGLLGQQLGLQPTLLIGACGMLAGTLWVLGSPLPALRASSDVAGAPAGAAPTAETARPAGPVASEGAASTEAAAGTAGRA